MILNLIFWILGLIITSFTVIPILIIIFFGIPTTLKLERLDALKHENGIVRKYAISALILSSVFTVIVFVVFFFFPTGLPGLLYGGGMAMLFGFSQLGANRSNVSDYLETNKSEFLVSVEQVASVLLNRKS